MVISIPTVQPYHNLPLPLQPPAHPLFGMLISVISPKTFSLECCPIVVSRQILIIKTLSVIRVILKKPWTSIFSMSMMKTSCPLELIISEVWRPSPINTISGYKYCLVFVDHFTRYKWIYPLKSKTDFFISPQLFTKVGTYFAHKIHLYRRWRWIFQIKLIHKIHLPWRWRWIFQIKTILKITWNISLHQFPIYSWTYWHCWTQTCTVKL